MVIRQRAMQAEDKQERHAAILDAAERLLARGPERVASVAEVADEAGLAKGTVYLYFPSKEELLLAVHERAIDGFFRAVIATSRGRATARHRRHAARSRASTSSCRRCSSSSPHTASASWRTASPRQRLRRSGSGWTCG